MTVITLSFFVFFLLVLIFRHLNYYTAQYDLGNMDQVMWQTLKGHWFHMIDPGNGALISRFVYHADVLLLAYLPLYLLAPHPLTLTILQLVAVFSAVFPLFWFARRRLPDWVSAIVALSVLTYPPLLWNVLFDVHAVTLSIPLVLWAVWALDTRRWWIYGVMVFLLPLGKETVGMTVAVLGALVFWKVRPRKIGLVTSLYGLTVTALMMFVVIPSVRHSSDHFYLRQYAEFGSTTGEVATSIIRQPGKVLGTMFDRDGIKYAFHLLGPLAGIPLLAVPYVLTIGPEFAINTLSSYQGMQTIFFQYTSVITPLLLLSFVIGVGWLWKWTAKYRWLRYAGVAGIVLCQVGFLFYDAPFPVGRHRGVLDAFQASPYRAQVAMLKKSIGENEVVSVTNTLGPQFSRRDKLFMFPAGIEAADVIVALFHQGDVSPTAINDRATIGNIKKDQRFTVILDDGDIVAVRRKK